MEEQRGEGVEERGSKEREEGEEGRISNSLCSTNICVQTVYC